jgi:hypothetical protein
MLRAGSRGWCERSSPVILERRHGNGFGFLRLYGRMNAMTDPESDEMDMDRVPCGECGAIGPIEDRARVDLVDKTEEKSMGGGTVTVYLCPPCFEKQVAIREKGTAKEG